MENEVIIDGVNVAECEFYTKGISAFCTGEDWFCADIKDCDFKQLQRLKKENEKLKDKAYKDADMIYQLTEENREYDIDLSIEKEAHKSTIEQLDKYHQALEEIKKELLQKSCANSEETRNVIAMIDEVLG